MYYVLKNKTKYEQDWDIVGVFTTIEDMETNIQKYESGDCFGMEWIYESFEELNHIY